MPLVSKPNRNARAVQECLQYSTLKEYFCMSADKPWVCNVSNEVGNNFSYERYVGRCFQK